MHSHSTLVPFTCPRCGMKFRHVPLWPLRCRTECGWKFSHAEDPGTPSPGRNIDCEHRGEPTGELLECKACGGTKRMPVYRCLLHKVECIPRRHQPHVGKPREIRNCVDCVADGEDQ